MYKEDVYMGNSYQYSYIVNYITSTIVWIMMKEKEHWALDELLEELRPGEEVQYVVFSEPEIYDFTGPNGEDFIPPNLIGVLIPFEKAKKYFYGWNIAGGYGGADVVPFFAWTNKRVLFIGCYDGATWLESVPRNPTNIVPYTVGGGC